ncbi:Anti-sigma-K factor rskA [Pirellulimonas nuda]|uniref:Regulator of SigK n=1 Tax=Pirellulimonas nuda TaxID=2528009 RepID=A0A518D676_9BACT|nr:anti-sigma factor [Pirellulimonas nuda]QDU86975.1 Anti-sigma-K factor rskA [Pirellulimonas nuda]
MNNPCKSLDDLLALAALGALDPPEQAEVDAHLATGCGRCAQQLASFREASEGLNVLNVSMTPPPEVRERLLLRVRAAKAQREPKKAPSRWLALAPYAAAAAVFAAVGAWVASRSGPARAPVALPSVAQWTEEVGGAALNRCSQGVLVDGRPGDDATAGNFLWDPVAGQLHLIAFGLEDDAANPTLRAWLKDEAGGWQALGDLRRDAPGVHVAAVRVDADRQPGATLYVTREPAGPAGPEPTGPVVLEGDLGAALPGAE